jgi:hypothetical protein
MHDHDSADTPEYRKNGIGHRGGATSRAGAIKVHNDGSAATQMALVLAAYERAGPAGGTAATIYDALKDKVPSLHTVRSRIRPLVVSGKLADSGRVEDGGFGVMVKVWVLARYAPPPADAEGQGELFGQAA